MDCNTVKPFISVLYDGEEVPQEAVQHILACDLCQTRLRDYGRITSEMRLLAANGEGGNPPVETRFPPRRNWLTALGKSVRVPRAVVAATVALLALAAVGLVRSGAQEKLITVFLCQVKTPLSSPESMGGESPLRVGSPDTESAFVGDEGYAYKVEALDIRDTAVVLQVRVQHFSRRVDFDEVRKQLERVTPQTITYVPGEKVSIAADGGGSVVLQGSVMHWEELPHGQSNPAAALLPAPGQIDIQLPVLIRDGKELLAFVPAGQKVRCDLDAECGFSLYIPGQGLFYFSPHPLQGAVEGKSFMSLIGFREGRHDYTLFAKTPIIGGDQPQTIWVVHLRNYLPSGHHGAKSEDALFSLGQGPLPAF